MYNLTYAEIQAELAGRDLSWLQKFNIAVLRNITVESIEPLLRYEAAHLGLNAAVSFGQFDNIFQETVGEDEELLQSADCILVFTHLETLSPAFSMSFSSLGKDDIKSELERNFEYFRSVLAGIRKKTESVVLWHGVVTPAHPSFGIADWIVECGQRKTIHQLNELLREALNEVKSAYYVDMDACAARVGHENFFDARFWHIGKAPYHRRALMEIAREDFVFIRGFIGKTKKCLVLDCDNTLWGGILGEDGIQNIQLSRSHPGSSFWEFQREIVNLHNRGVLIALCSKNNEADVWEVFDTHPDMVLKREHISSAQINWEDKASNIKRIADELNIGLDSLVYLDDSAFEINLIKCEVPEVMAIQLMPEQAVKYRKILSSGGWFDRLSVTEEDKQRGAMYRAEIKRKKLRGQTTDLTEYYRSLNMNLEIRFITEATLPRITQLTQKTNQFNLTTKRYTETEIHSFMTSKDHDILGVRLNDRFGDSGIIGAGILDRSGHPNEARIDTFLLSCRVLGRGVEDMFLAHLMRLAAAQGVLRVIGVYVQTKKNEQVKEFYPRHGFISEPLSLGIEEGRGLSSNLFSADLGVYSSNVPDFFDSVISDVDYV